MWCLVSGAASPLWSQGMPWSCWGTQGNVCPGTALLGHSELGSPPCLPSSCRCYSPFMIFVDLCGVFYPWHSLFCCAPAPRDHFSFHWRPQVLAQRLTDFLQSSFTVAHCVCLPFLALNCGGGLSLSSSQQNSFRIGPGPMHDTKTEENLISPANTTHRHWSSQSFCVSMNRPGRTPVHWWIKRCHPPETVSLIVQLLDAISMTCRAFRHPFLILRMLNLQMQYFQLILFLLSFSFLKQTNPRTFCHRVPQTPLGNSLCIRPSSTWPIVQ